MRIPPPILAALLLLAFRPASAAELSEPRTTLLAKHGTPWRVDADGAVYYRWDAWILGIRFTDGVVGCLNYEKSTPLAAADIFGVLTANGGQTSWTKTGERVWTRNDGALATLDQAGGRRLSLVSAPRPVQFPSTPAAVKVQAGTSLPLATPTPGLIAPLKPFQSAPQTPHAGRPNPEPPKGHFWLMVLSWVPPLLLAMFGKYMLNR